jgi:addiction module RelB/DinJ family antitoxin
MPTLTIQVDDRVQSEAEAVLSAQGLSIADVVNLTLRRIATERRLPADLVASSGHEETLCESNQPCDDLTSLQAFGMWADRDDMENPSKWVRDLRRGRYRDF